MTTKDWLNRARYIDKELDALMSARQAAYMACIATTPKLRADIVSCQKDPHEKLERFAELNVKVDDKMCDLLSVKQEILDAIWTVEDSTYRVLLTERYVNLKTWEQIAVEMNYSYMQVCRIHGKALAEVKM